MWWVEHAKDIAEAVALACAAGYFLFKAYTGYFRVNLSLSLECSRHAAHSSNDTLVVRAILTKGTNGSLTLHDVQARVIYGEATSLLVFRGIERSSYDSVTSPFPRKVIAWSRVSAQSPMLKLVPEEVTELAAFCEVPSGAVCTVEFAVVGQKTNRKPLGQWKATSVSVPRAA